MPDRRFSLFSCLVVTAACLLGCQTTPKEEQDYGELFSAGRYSEAYDAASKVAGSMRGSNRDQAAMVAGLSAQALNRNEDAKRWLTPLAMNSDEGVAGKANASLGLIAQEENKHREAVDHLTKAGKRLTGDESARSYMYAGDSLRALNKDSEAAAMYAAARDKVVADDSLRVMIGDRLNSANQAITGRPSPSGQYTVQVGAYSTINRAQVEVKRYRTFGPTRIVQIRDSQGRPLHAVRVGYYRTKQEADLMRRNIGKNAMVTTTKGE
jgi:tetratricopeptide (TPR) repeat protein